jgi:hypothetical protein
MKTKPKSARRSDVWSIRRRDFIIGIIALVVLLPVIVLTILIGPDLLRYAARPLRTREYVAHWCDTNLDQDNCADWAKEYVRSHPSIVPLCGPSTVDVEALYWCIDRYMGLDSEVATWCRQERLRRGIVEADLNCYAWSQTFINDHSAVIEKCWFTFYDQGFEGCMTANVEQFP